MGHQPDNLLESDRIEDVLEDSGPPPPVLVVQHGNRVLPWLLMLGTIVLLSLGTAYAYHRREVARLRRQAEMAQRDLQRAIEQAKAEENQLRLESLPTPPAAVPTVNPGPATSPGLSVAQVSSGAGASNGGQASGATTPGEKPPPPAAEAGRPDAKPAGPPRPRVLARLVEKTDPARGPGPPAGSPPGASDPPGPAGSGAPVAAASDPASRGPFDESNGGGEPGPAPTRVDADAAPASAAVATGSKPGDPPAANPGTPAAPPAETPLPSREEIERQINTEAAAKKREGDQKLEQQQEELQALRNDERRQFIDELRMVLQVHGRLAGEEIERLSDRTGRTEDPALLMQARRVIAETRMSQRSKLRRLRNLGVPETVILDYLANNLNKNLGGRNGPRNRNEVWIKAAETLLKSYDDDARRPAASPAGQPAGGGTARPR